MAGGIFVEGAWVDTNGVVEVSISLRIFTKFETQLTKPQLDEGSLPNDFLGSAVEAANATNRRGLRALERRQHVASMGEGTWVIREKAQRLLYQSFTLSVMARAALQQTPSQPKYRVGVLPQMVCLPEETHLFLRRPAWVLPVGLQTKGQHMAPFSFTRAQVNGLS